MCMNIQTKLELEVVRSSSVGTAESSEEPSAGGGAGELQAALELVAELRKQLQSVKDETSEREKTLQAEIEKLTKAGDSQERSTGQLPVSLFVIKCTSNVVRGYHYHSSTVTRCYSFTL